MKYLFTKRLCNLWLSLSCFGMLAFAIYYLEAILWQEPCPLCKLQRVVFFILAFIAGLAFLHNPKLIGARIYAFLMGVTACIGASISIRHIWIQLYPSEDASAVCHAMTSSITDVLDFKIIKDILFARGDCGVIDWTFLGLSIPMWAFCGFIGVGLLGIVNNWRKN